MPHNKTRAPIAPFALFNPWYPEHPMQRSEQPYKRIITAEQVANYVVCPEAWRLKYLGRGRKQHSERTEEGQRRRRNWVETQDLSATLRSYAKIVYLLLVLVAIVVFLMEQKRSQTRQQLRRPAQPPAQEARP